MNFFLLGVCECAMISNCSYFPFFPFTSHFFLFFFWVNGPFPFRFNLFFSCSSSSTRSRSPFRFNIIIIIIVTMIAIIMIESPVKLISFYCFDGVLFALLFLPFSFSLSHLWIFCTLAGLAGRADAQYRITNWLLWRFPFLLSVCKCGVRAFIFDAN